MVSPNRPFFTTPQRLLQDVGCIFYTLRFSQTTFRVRFACFDEFFCNFFCYFIWWFREFVVLLQCFSRETILITFPATSPLHEIGSTSLRHDRASSIPPQRWHYSSLSYIINNSVYHYPIVRMPDDRGEGAHLRTRHCFNSAPGSFPLKQLHDDGKETAAHRLCFASHYIYLSTLDDGASDPCRGAALLNNTIHTNKNHLIYCYHYGYYSITETHKDASTQLHQVSPNGLFAIVF